MPKHIAESRRLTTEAGGSGRLKVGLITPGFGSSGYYSAKVLENAAKAKVIPAGTQMFLDHPGEHEMYDRPERSVRDLAAVTTEDAVWDGSVLSAEAQVFGPYRDLLTDETFAKTIGVSIRAWAEAVKGEAEGRPATIITELTEVESVDFVTKAGRGGSILAIMESARPERVNARAARHGVEEATANDTRQALQQALTEMYGGEQSYVWVMDFDASTVWYQHETPDSASTWAEGYTMDGNLATLAGLRSEVVARTEYVPVSQSAVEADRPPVELELTGSAALEAWPTGTTFHVVNAEPAGDTLRRVVTEATWAASTGRTDVPAPAGQSTATESPQEGSPMATTQIEEAELGRLRQDAERVPTLESDLTTARRQLALHEARETARPIAEGIVNASATLTPTMRNRVARESVAAVQVDADGKFDADAFKATVEAARTAAETEWAQVLVEAGAGTVTGFGSVPAGDIDYVKTAESAVDDAFGRTPKGA